MWIVKVKEQVLRAMGKKENPQWKLNNNKTNLVNTPLTLHKPHRHIHIQIILTEAREACQSTFTEPQFLFAQYLDTLLLPINPHKSPVINLN